MGENRMGDNWSIHNTVSPITMILCFCMKWTNPNWMNQSNNWFRNFRKSRSQNWIVVLSYVRICTRIVNWERATWLFRGGISGAGLIYIWLQVLTWISETENCDFHRWQWQGGPMDNFGTQYITLGPQETNFLVRRSFLIIPELKINHRA